MSQSAKNYESWSKAAVRWTLAWGTWCDVGKNEGKMFEKGIFLKNFRVPLISFSDSHRKRQNFSNYKSLQLHPKLNGTIISTTKGIWRILLAQFCLKNQYYFQKEGHTGLGSWCYVLSNINWVYQHWETISWLCKSHGEYVTLDRTKRLSQSILWRWSGRCRKHAMKNSSSNTPSATKPPGGESSWQTLG